VNYQIQLGTLSVDQLVSAYLAWQSFAATAPKELAMAAGLSASGGSVSMTFSGNYYGSASQFQGVIAPLMASLPSGTSLSAKALGWIDGLVALAGSSTLSTAQPDAVCHFHTFLDTC
jgi:hypothetical protein